MKDQITALQAALGTLSSRDHVFALSLIEAFHRGRLTVNQAPWVSKLIERSSGHVAPVPVKVNLGSFSQVVALFAKAKTTLKWPKITLDCAGSSIVLSVAGPSSKNPGAINVAGEGAFHNRAWYGSINAAGGWTPSAQLERNPALKTAMEALLVEFGNDPAGVARKYGHLTGNCCFCHTKLTDERSTAAGFGPVCADHYGLKAEWKAAAATSAIAPAESVAA